MKLRTSQRADVWLPGEFVSWRRRQRLIGRYATLTAFGATMALITVAWWAYEGHRDRRLARRLADAAAPAVELRELNAMLVRSISARQTELQVLEAVKPANELLQAVGSLQRVFSRFDAGVVVRSFACKLPLEHDEGAEDATTLPAWAAGRWTWRIEVTDPLLYADLLQTLQSHPRLQPGSIRIDGSPLDYNASAWTRRDDAIASLPLGPVTIEAEPRVTRRLP